MKLSALKTELPAFTEYLHGTDFHAVPKAILKKYKTNKDTATKKLTDLLEAIVSKDSWAKKVHGKKSPLQRLAKQTIKVMKSSHLKVPSEMKKAFKQKTLYSKEAPPAPPAPTVHTRDELIEKLKKRQFKGLDFAMDHSVVDEESVKKLDAALKKTDFRKRKSNQTLGKKLMTQALEVKKLFKDTHYTFTHAQPIDFLGATILTKELVHAYDPRRDIRGFKFLRVPPKGPHTALAINKSINDDKKKTRDELLSCSPYMFDHGFMESALNFLVCPHTNILTHGKSRDIAFLHTLYKDTIKKFTSHHVKEKAITKAVDDIFKELKTLATKTQTAALYTISIPKETLKKEKEKLGYLAHPFGRPCKHHGKLGSEESFVALDKLQNDAVDHSVKKCSFAPKTVPQYRLQIKRVTPESGAIIQRFTPFEKKDLQVFKQKVAEIVAGLKSQDTARA